MRLARKLGAFLFLLFVSLPLFGQQLEIHYIDVGWGGSVFIKGPDGTTVLLEAGNTGKGTQYVVPYLKSIGVQPANGIDYVIGGHQHCDHVGGLDEVINAGYDVHIRQYYNGSTYASSCVDGWNAAAAGTTAGAPVIMPVGTVIPLGNGAKITCVARNGSIIGGGFVSVSDENDRSIALLIQYGGFDYLWASDLGGGSDGCTGRSTAQVNVETSVIQAISPGGASPMISAGGIDLLHVNHHGSESSTNPDYFNMADPAVAIIGVGDGESSGWDLPRIDVVEHVLLAQSTACVTAPPTFVLQTEEGNPAGSLTSYAGYCVGNITITTDGLNIFTVSADGAVHQGPNELVASGLPQSFTIDDSPTGPDTTPPATSVTSPANGATVSGTISVTASASDNVGVTNVEFYLDGVLQTSDAAAPYSWSWNTTSAGNGSHTLTSKAYDAAGNNATSAGVTVTVSNDATAPTTSITAPANGSTVSGTVSVTASASDDVGVTKVEFYLDGALKSTDTASPYSWSWDTTTAGNGTHTLTSKAYDAAGNSGMSAAVSVNVNNPTAIDISGWVITQANATYNFTIPQGTIIPVNGYVVIGRDATQSRFQKFWHVTLGSNVVYIDSAGGMPVINGDENYTLKDAAGNVIDGPTISMSSSALQDIQRKDPCLASDLVSSWNIGATSAANPGSGAGTGCGRGVVINEFSDASGTGKYIYEFIELHNDR